MSCLMLAELPLSDQVAIELAWAAKLDAVFRDVFTVLDPPAQKATSLAPLPLGAGGSDSILHAEPCT